MHKNGTCFIHFWLTSMCTPFWNAIDMSFFQHVVFCQRLRLPCYSWISVREVNFLFDFVNVLTILGPVSTSVTFVNSSLQRGKLKLQETVLNTLVFSKAPMFGRSKVCSKVVSCMYQTNFIIWLCFSEVTVEHSLRVDLRNRLFSSTCNVQPAALIQKMIN